MAGNNVLFIMLHLSTVLVMILFYYIARKKNKAQIHLVFLCYLGLLFIWCTSLIAETYLMMANNPLMIYFEYLTYLGICFIPVTLLLIGVVYAKTKIRFSIKYAMLLFVPVLTTIMIWTNEFHHLFYRQFSLNGGKVIFGEYFYIHTVYSYIIILIGLYYLLFFSIKNSGFFSRQAILIFLGSIVPFIVNLFVTIGIFPTTPYATPITFVIAVICYVFSILKYEFLNISPIALQSIVDRISDSFIVVNNNLNVIDFNKTFLDIFQNVFQIKRNINFLSIFDNKPQLMNIRLDFEMYLEKTREKRESHTFEVHFKNELIDKYFMVEVTPVISSDSYLGTIVLMKDITQAKLDLEIIKENQAILVEQERLASLGQLIGGIAHNIRTPIMSLSGAIEALKDLAYEYRDSIDDKSVTEQDHKDIAKEMLTWLDKMRPYCAYMSDVISAVKGQAVQMNASTMVKFTIDELIKRVDLLMRHELKKNHVTLNVDSQIDMNTEIKGEVSNLIQVFDNIIINAVHAYEGKEGTIELKILRSGDNIEFVFKDTAKGIPKEITDRLFKEMVTTKGKNGTGLGLYMSYSTVRGRFGGNMSFNSIQGIGTTFYISIPCISYNQKEVS